jgi:hypothetical protein
MITLVKVLEAKVLAGNKLWLRFSDGREGVRDFADIFAAGGPVVEPLRDAAFFARVFVKYGVPAWPNGSTWMPSRSIRRWRQPACCPSLLPPEAADASWRRAAA